MSDLLPLCLSCHPETDRLFCDDLRIIIVWQERPQVEEKQSHPWSHLQGTTALVVELSPKRAREHQTSLLGWGILLSLRENNTLASLRSFVVNFRGDILSVLLHCFQSGSHSSFLVPVGGTTVPP